MGKDNLDSYVPLVRFMAEMHGPDAEIVLYDVEDCCVYYVEHPFDEDMKPGSAMRSLEKSFLEQHRQDTEEFIVNYRALSRSKEKLKSATLFLKSMQGDLVAILTVNQKVERLIDLRNLIDEIISGTRPYDQKRNNEFYDSFDVSVSDIVTKTIVEELATFHMPPSRLDAKEKMQLVKNLDAKGIFLVKGAVGELAKMLTTTETTVYRYINRLSESADSDD